MLRRLIDIDSPHTMAAEAAPHTPQEPPANVTIDGKTYPSLADGEYDVIVLGTGLKEVLLAGMLAKEQGKRVSSSKAVVWRVSLAKIMPCLHSRQTFRDARYCTHNNFYLQVLVIDRNSYYGGEAASLNLTVSSACPA